MIQPATDLYAAYKDVLQRNGGTVRLEQFKTRGKGLRPLRRRGMVKAAAQLGISRQHLYDVIHGYRRSARIQAWIDKNLKEEGR